MPLVAIPQSWLLLPDGAMALIVIKTGEGLKYIIADEWLPKKYWAGSKSDPSTRYDSIINADDLFRVEPIE